MGTKAKLTVVLKADSTVVAESEDAKLWQQVFAAIQGTPLVRQDAGQSIETQEDSTVGKRSGGDQAIGEFARTLEVSADTVIGALSPSRVEPYLHLDHHCWAAMKKGTPVRGTGSLSATLLAGTLLALWFQAAKIDVEPTQALAAQVLDTIKIKDRNAGRGIKNTKWIQGRGNGVIVLNAAEITKAIEVARAFCTKQWSAGGKAT